MPELQEPLLTKRFRDWLTPAQQAVADESARPFFQHAAVVLDANVLLDLYRYTKDGRDQVISVLELIGTNRLWLPHQIGLEFSRNRAKAVQGRVNSLHAAGKTITSRFETAARLIREARDDVADLVREMAQDDAAADAIVEAIPDKRLEEVLQPWQAILSDSIKNLRAAETVSPKLVLTNDPLLPKIAALFGQSVGEPFSEMTLRDLVERAVKFRFPNKIPPGFADTTKETDLLAAGDYIAWEQIVGHAKTLNAVRRVIFVSGDTKGDWYELDTNGKPLRPRPALYDEMRRRSNAELLILTPREFLRGAQVFLDAPVEPETYEDVDRVASASAVRQTRASRDVGLSPFGSGGDPWDRAGLESDDKNRLQRRLDRVLQEHEILNAQLSQLQGDGGHVHDFEDPRSFVRAIASRVQVLSDEANELRSRLHGQ